MNIDLKQMGKQYAWLLIILLATFVVYFPSLQFAFYPNLDDGRLILNNPVVTDFPNHFKAIFTEFVFGLYHPLTTLSFIFDYQLFGANPLGFRVHNLILHLLNTLLVFILIKQIGKKHVLAVFSATIFALHPMHLESVIWISERKDVLFTLYFLLSLISYGQFKETKGKWWLVLATAFFIMSSLAKATAVVLPVIFIILDYHNDKKFHLQFVLKKWFLLGLSIVFGVINIKAQNSIDFIQPIANHYSIHQLITIPLYSFTWYIVKFFAPLGLAAKHLYPRVIDGQINWLYYSSWIGFAVFSWCFYLFRKNKLFIFGVLFYIITIGLLIKIIPTGNDIVSERYTYVPYIGLSLAFGALFINHINKFQRFINPVLLVLVLLLGFASRKQASTWNDETSIWSRVAETAPDMPLAYFERGKAYQDKKEFSKAILDYKKAILLAPNFYEAYINKGLCNYFERNNEQALNDFTLAIQLEPKNAIAYYHRGNLNLKMNRLEASIVDFEQSITLGFAQDEVYYYKGLAEQKLNLFEASNSSFRTYAGLKPNHTEVLYLIANNLARMEQFNEALTYYNQFIALNQQMAGAYLNRGNVYLYLNDTEKACADWNKALELGGTRAQQMIEQYCNP